MKLWDLYKGKDYDIVPTLERIRRAAEYLGNPQRKFPSIIVGGTNGKGSTCAFLERILREHSFKTGWFISPHLVDERERWRIGGKIIPKDLYEAYVKDLKPIFERFNLTYFEATVMVAIKVFSDLKVDVAIMEVGMGGRWDATKVCDPSVVIITNVQRDHVRWLGKNVRQIAGEKLALRRSGVPLVLGSARFPLYTEALTSLDDIYVAGIDFTYWSYLSPPKAVLKNFKFKDLFLDEVILGIPGRWQADNSALALVGARLFTPLEEQRVRLALSKARWEGRMEILREKPLLVVDGSHNPDAVRTVMSGVDLMFPGIEILFTGLDGKEWENSLEIIRKFRNSILLTAVSHHRGVPVERLEREARKKGFRSVKILNSPADVWELNFDVLALGSLYLVGEIKSAGSFTVI